MIPSTTLFDNAGKPTPELLALMNLTGVLHEGTLSSIRDATQKQWFQQGRIRADIVEQHGAIKNQAMQLFSSLGFVQAVRPPEENRHYKHAFLLGAKLRAVRKRLFYLKELWDNGCRFDNIHLLGSSLPLGDDELGELSNAQNAEFPFEESVTLAGVTTQATMMKCVYQQSLSLLPWKATVGMTCLRMGPDREKANTEDTFVAWDEIKRHESTGTCLVVSSQPFVSFQRVIACKVLGQRHPIIHAVGYESPQKIPVTAFFDNTAKIIFEVAVAAGL